MLSPSRRASSQCSYHLIEHVQAYPGRHQSRAGEQSALCKSRANLKAKCGLGLRHGIRDKYLRSREKALAPLLKV